MRPGIHKNDSDSSPGPSLEGSFRKSTSAKFVPTSNRVYSVLKEYSSKLVDPTILAHHLHDWVTNNLDTKNDHHFTSPFSLDELRIFDYALEGLPLQQLLRMPFPPYASENLREDEFLALEDFLHTSAEGLWHTFWHKNKPFPFFVSCPRYPGSKFYTIEKALSRGRLSSLSGVALISKNTARLHARWDDVVNFVLFKKNLAEGQGFICEAIFNAIHLLFSRSLSKYTNVTTDYVFVSVMDSKYGGVIKLGGDLGKLEVDLSNPYQSMAEWIMCHADVSVSGVDRIWNKLGNVNWGDLGTLQMLMAIFYSMVQWNGPPRKSMESLAANHSLRLQKRRMESRVVENENEVVSCQNGEIVEVGYENNLKSERNELRLSFAPGEILLLEDRNQGLKSYQIQEFFLDSNDGYSYIAVDSESRAELLNLYVGAHPSRLEPSWEDMNLWYQVQRQTKVLNILKEQGVSSKHLPEIIASGRIVHSGSCEKPSPKERCDHPWCGTPMLAACPVGEPLSSIMARDGPFSGPEATRCCRDCLSALRSAKAANILHGDIRPENVIRIVDERGPGVCSVFVLVSWGRAVLEERDSPPLNLQFSSAHALQNGKLCPSSDIESLVYLLYYLIGGSMKEVDSIESGLKWRRRCWAKRAVQQRLGEVSPLLKAFADYVDSICGTTYAVDYDVWLRRLDRAVDESGERGKMVEDEMRVKDVAESSGGGNSL
ncbi:hypothetical protein CASFOL_018305 [Castilleja foliolosa]|uniref:Protein kinase domain-containing protein n=1 Tax=Castilleja foliolosa TaxID=1961234 RepID=A0ABD3D7B5_9LAMI